MDPARLDVWLRETLDDGRLSRGERSALGDVFAALDNQGVALARARVFALAREELDRRPPGTILDWCESVLQLLGSRTAERLAGERDLRQEAWFSPADACARRIVEAIDGARESVDVCVFALTDDRIAEALVAAHRRSVPVRVITDDDKATEPGADAAMLAAAGIPVRTDHSPAHMHHKFALFDDRAVLTGSYNWTRSAARDNRENFVWTDDPVLRRRYRREFDSLWREFDAT